jgi:hypothetical protein
MRAHEPDVRVKTPEPARSKPIDSTRPSGTVKKNPLLDQLLADLASSSSSPGNTGTGSLGLGLSGIEGMSSLGFMNPGTSSMMPSESRTPSRPPVFRDRDTGDRGQKSTDITISIDERLIDSYIQQILLEQNARREGDILDEKETRDLDQLRDSLKNSLSRSLDVAPGDVEKWINGNLLNLLKELKNRGGGFYADSSLSNVLGQYLFGQPIILSIRTDEVQGDYKLMLINRELAIHDSNNLFDPSNMQVGHYVGSVRASSRDLNPVVFTFAHSNDMAVEFYLRITNFLSKDSGRSENAVAELVHAEQILKTLFTERFEEVREYYGLSQEDAEAIRLIARDVLTRNGYPFADPLSESETRYLTEIEGPGTMLESAKPGAAAPAAVSNPDDLLRFLSGKYRERLLFGYERVFYSEQDVDTLIEAMRTLVGTMYENPDAWMLNVLSRVAPGDRSLKNDRAFREFFFHILDYLADKHSRVLLRINPNFRDRYVSARNEFATSL